MRPTLYVLLGVLLVANVGFAGDIVTDGKFKSTQASGAPLEVASDDMVLNLNADMVDGVEGTDIYTKAEVDAAIAAAGAADSRRWFYLTPDVVENGANALTACDAGFHMASIYEILDVSNLRYDTYRGHTTDDSGQGPPAGFGGWVRTGTSSYTGAVLGRANCNAWTSSSASHSGTWANLADTWVPPTIEPTNWQGMLLPCDAPSLVWCVED